METMDTAQLAEEQVSDAPNADVSTEASQQVNSTVVATTPTGEPVDVAEAAIESFEEDTAADEVEVVVAETETTVERGDEVTFVDETVSEIVDDDGNERIVDETVTDVLHADGSETVVVETVAAAVDEAGDIAVVDEIVTEEIDADGNLVEDEEFAQVYEIMDDDTGQPTMSTMADLVDDFAFKPLKTGETRDGIIVSISPSEILVDVGAKSEGFVLQREMERNGREYVENYSVGDSAVVYVVRPEDRDGNVVLSLARAQQERDWREAERLQETAEVFESQVIGHNRGGVICRVGKVRGFVPASQLVSKPEVPPDTDEENRWASLVGENLWLKVVEMDRKRNRLILSERLASRERRRGRKDELMGELKKGDVRKGRISSLAKFGAFVDLGGADGLIHLSELSWSRVNHPSEVVTPGQIVEVYVLNVDRDRKRIGLSLRRLNPEPWSVVHEKYAVGQIVDGVITKLANFGAFARVDGAIEGLIHISELANHRVTHPREVVKEGEELKLRIVRIDPARKRMGLSLKRVDDEAYAEVDWRAEDIEDDVDVTWEEADEFDD